MEITIKFTMPDDEESYQYCIKGRDYKRSIDEFLEKLRSIIKYQTPVLGKIDQEGLELIETIREEFIKILNENNAL
jgi:hypothetical protein